ncbi:amino acid-binding protein [Desulfovibrio aminophilus]|nr:phage regulatory CII family protein [Desulfovibrio aminophilus]MCM0754963.1 amino acid-binding protein [Desulfovibrio aminophilus]
MYRKSITKIVQDMVLEGERPAKQLAADLGKPYSTLLREVNPFDKNAKLGVETLMQIMKLTKNEAPLRYMAQELGFTLVPSAKTARAELSFCSTKGSEARAKAAG